MERQDTAKRQDQMGLVPSGNRFRIRARDLMTLLQIDGNGPCSPYRKLGSYGCGYFLHAEKAQVCGSHDFRGTRVGLLKKSLSACSRQD